MASFAISAPTNIDSLTGKTGGDTFTINGSTLTIDQDSRYGLNQTTSTSLGNITVSATLGGTCLIDGRATRLLSYTGGTGTVPASNTIISQGSASGKLVGVWSSLTAAPIAAGSAMPATGFIKIKQWNNTEYASGALTGISATSSGASVVGWLEIVGDEAGIITVPRLGSFQMLGAWYSLGTTNGTAGQTFQVPSSGSSVYIPGVYIEKTVGSNNYEFYPNAGSQTTIATDIRAKVCFITTAGLVRIGNNGTTNAGFTPVTGLKVVIPNIIAQNCTTALRTANALPNATLTTRYRFSTTGGADIQIDKACVAWYMTFSQAYSISLLNTCTLEQILVSETASAMTWTKVGVGQTAAQTQSALAINSCKAGGTFTDCTWSRATLAASGNYCVTETDCTGFTHTNETYISLTVKGNATTGNYLGTRNSNCSWTGTKLTNGRMVFVTCSNITCTTTSYADVITGVTATTAAQNSYVWELQSVCSNIVLSGLDWFGITNVNAFLGVLNIAAAGCNLIKLRNIGSRATPLSMGTTAATQGAVLFNIANQAVAKDIRIQRCYVINTRTNLWVADNSTDTVIIDNCMGDDADAPLVATLNAQIRGTRCTLPLTAQTAVYGTHWFDIFTSATVGRIGLVMNEKTSSSPSSTVYSITAGSPKFTSAGGLYMPTIGDQIVFTMPYFAVGHDSFKNAAAVMAGGTIGNYTLEYQIDKNDGSGFNGTWKTLSGANLSAETGITTSLGVKLMIRITTTVTNTTAITSLYVLTNSTAVSQDNQYTLDTVNVTLTGLKSNSEIRVYLDSAGVNGTEIAGVESSGTSFTFSPPASSIINIVINNLIYLPADIWGLNTGVLDLTIPISQFVDRNYSNPV